MKRLSQRDMRRLWPLLFRYIRRREQCAMCGSVVGPGFVNVHVYHTTPEAVYPNAAVYFCGVASYDAWLRDPDKWRSR